MDTPNVSRQGGYRPGSGRPPLSSSEPTVRTTITLPRSVADYLRSLGGGNLSQGVRLAAAMNDKESPGQHFTTLSAAEMDAPRVTVPASKWTPPTGCTLTGWGATVPVADATEDTLVEPF